MVVGAGVAPVTAHACFVYTRGVRSCQTGMAQAWSELWLIAQVQVEFTGGLWYHWQNEWQTQNRVMEYYQEAICNPGRAWISKGCCLSEMKSSITSTSYLIRSWAAFKEKGRPFSHRIMTKVRGWSVKDIQLKGKLQGSDSTEVWKITKSYMNLNLWKCFTAPEFQLWQFEQSFSAHATVV